MDLAQAPHIRDRYREDKAVEHAVADRRGIRVRARAEAARAGKGVKIRSPELANVFAEHDQDGEDFDPLREGEGKQDIGYAPQGDEAGREDAEVVCQDREAGEERSEDVADAALEDVLVVGDFGGVVGAFNIEAAFVVGAHGGDYGAAEGATLEVESGLFSQL